MKKVDVDLSNANKLKELSLEEQNSLAGALARALQGRRGVMAEDSGDDSNSDDGW